MSNLNNSEHAYSKSELHNIKWAIKRNFIYKNNSVDDQIFKHLSDVITKNITFEVGLNIGCGFHTPYDKLMNKISMKTINIDTSLAVRLFRPISGKRLKLSETNWKYNLGKLNPQIIYCFHSFSFININWLNFVEYCTENNIKFCFDWPVTNSDNAQTGTNKFCVDEGANELLKILLKNKYNFYDLSNYEETVSINLVNSGDRLIVNNF